MAKVFWNPMKMCSPFILPISLVWIKVSHLLPFMVGVGASICYPTSALEILIKNEGMLFAGLLEQTFNILNLGLRIAVLFE